MNTSPNGLVDPSTGSEPTTTSSLPPPLFPASKQSDPPGHSFLSAVNEVKNMENSLLSLLTSFHSGDLSAFGKGHSLETMEAVRAKQEKLARMHFDLSFAKSQQQGDSSQDWLSNEEQQELVGALRELSKEIEKLHDTSS